MVGGEEEEERETEGGRIQSGDDWFFRRASENVLKVKVSIHKIQSRSIQRFIAFHRVRFVLWKVYSGEVKLA